MRIKILNSILLTAMGLVVFGVFFQNTAKAQLPVIETNPILIAAATNTSVQTSALTAQEIAKRAFVIATEALKRRMLNIVVDQIIGWIEGEGQPKFVTDWKSFISDAANIAVGDVAYELGLGFLCNPFSLNVQLTLLKPPRFNDFIACTLDDIVGNIQNFYDDFRNGGWLSYAELWQPRNNYYGSVLMAMQERDRRIANETEASVFEALSGGGFLGTRRCDSTGRFCSITTPGSQIGALAAKAIGSDIDYLINANDLAVYVGAIADALINRLIRSGAEGLISLTTPNQPPNGSFSGGGACSGLRGSSLTECLALVRSGSVGFAETQRSYLTEIDATLLPQQGGETGLVSAVNSQNILVSRLLDLRNCQLNKGLPQATATEIILVEEQAELNNLDSDLNVSRSITGPLTNTKIQIQNPPARDISTISFYFNSIAFLLDSQAARDFQAFTEIRKNEVLQKVNGQLPRVQQQLTSCQGL